MRFRRVLVFKLFFFFFRGKRFTKEASVASLPLPPSLEKVLVFDFLREGARENLSEFITGALTIDGAH